MNARPSSLIRGEDPGVRRVGFLGRQIRGRPAEGHDREGRRRRDLDAFLALENAAEGARENEVAAEARPHAGGSEGAQRHPHLEGAEPAAELHAVIHVLAHRLPLGRLEIVRHDGEGAPHALHPAEEEPGALERHEHPLVRVEEDRVRALPAREEGAHLRQRCGRARVRRVHVEPDPLARAEVRERRQRVDGRDRRRAGGRDDGDGDAAGRPVFRDLRLEGAARPSGTPRRPGSSAALRCRARGRRRPCRSRNARAPSSRRRPGAGRRGPSCGRRETPPRARPRAR